MPKKKSKKSKKDIRVIIRMKSTESPYMYSTTKNKRNTQDRLEIKKYDPILRKHVIFKEVR